ncbi:dihydroxyacetone kinase subunit DhaL [Streptomyces litchfieldiae]|uniref:Dihydroxyacetone kinase subunit DhaL n=1 Tax=Streptomyces litchfieldiae TaxID=3075543 RepID=A0ABU2MMR2_9ACTN|nr:dihydroxyacetone kinase subunit DhaL [Streptomyces sp. DSM 44938]MDT0341949.1 dihydroxyacetone kinase subunit DhaL [Streptomyces sp. DSM 44938]
MSATESNETAPNATGANATGLDATGLRAMLLAVADRVIGAEPELSSADRAVGDGDHGLGMTRGFSAVRRLLRQDDPADPAADGDDVYAVLTATGNALIGSMGGASGVLFGLLFRAGAAGRPPADRLGTRELADWLRTSLAEITRRGGAKPGDKTLVDALDPAAASLTAGAAAGEDLPTALRRAARAAADGTDRTKAYVARFGKAMSLGERAIGFPDPGALSLTHILTAMADWAEHTLRSDLMNPTMTNEQLREHNANRKIYQIAFVTRDLEKTMRSWVENLGIGPWTVLTFTDQTMKYLKVDDREVTEPFKFLIAISWVGDMQLEILQPVYGPTIYQEFLDRRGEGLHHIKERVADENIDAVLEAYRSKGIDVLQTGQFDTDVHYYMGTEPKLDFIYELGNCPVLDLPPEMCAVYPPESADRTS